MGHYFPASGENGQPAFCFQLENRILFDSDVVCKELKDLKEAEAEQFPDPVADQLLPYLRELQFRKASLKRLIMKLQTQLGINT